MTGPRPDLTFFVELETPPLEELFARPDVLAFLAAQGCAVSMGLLDLSDRPAEVIRKLEASGIPVTGWLLLDLEDGSWLNADDADRRGALARPPPGRGARPCRCSGSAWTWSLRGSESEGAMRDRRRLFSCCGTGDRASRCTTRSATTESWSAKSETGPHGGGLPVPPSPRRAPRPKSLLRRSLVSWTYPSTPSSTCSSRAIWGVPGLASLRGYALHRPRRDGRRHQRQEPGRPPPLPLIGAVRGRVRDLQPTPATSTSSPWRVRRAEHLARIAEIDSSRPARRFRQRRSGAPGGAPEHSVALPRRAPHRPSDPVPASEPLKSR